MSPEAKAREEIDNSNSSCVTERQQDRGRLLASNKRYFTRVFL